MSSLPSVLMWLLAATSLVWVTLEVRQGMRRRPEARGADRGSRPLLGVAATVGVFVALYVARTVPALAVGDRTLAAVGALVLMVAAMALRLWSFRTLGRYFTFTVQTSADQTVVTTGPYRFVRHPAYTALLFGVVAGGLLVGNWGSVLVLLAAVTPALGYRIVVEERALERELGPAYRDFAAGRKRLVPFVW